MLKNAYTALEEAIPDSPCLTKTVDKYVRTLIERQQKHTKANLTAALVAAGCVSSQ
jgi:hypothetical protein